MDREWGSGTDRQGDTVPNYTVLLQDNVRHMGLREGVTTVSIAHSVPATVGSLLTRPVGAGVGLCGSLTSALSLASEEEQGALPCRYHHQLPGPLRLPGGPPGGLCPLSAAQVSSPWHCPWALSRGRSQVQGLLGRGVPPLTSVGGGDSCRVPGLWKPRTGPLLPSCLVTARGREEAGGRPKHQAESSRETSH